MKIAWSRQMGISHDNVENSLYHQIRPIWSICMMVFSNSTGKRVQDRFAAGREKDWRTFHCQRRLHQHPDLSRVTDCSSTQTGCHSFSHTPGCISRLPPSRGQFWIQAQRRWPSTSTQQDSHRPDIWERRGAQSSRSGLSNLLLDRQNKQSCHP